MQKNLAVRHTNERNYCRRNTMQHNVHGVSQPTAVLFSYLKMWGLVYTS